MLKNQQWQWFHTMTANVVSTGQGLRTWQNTFCLIVTVFMKEPPLNYFSKDSSKKPMLFAAKCIEPLPGFALQTLKGDFLQSANRRRKKHAFVQG